MERLNMGILSREAQYGYLPWSGKYGYPTSGYNTRAHQTRRSGRNSHPISAEVALP